MMWSDMCELETPKCSYMGPLKKIWSLMVKIN